MKHSLGVSLVCLSALALAGCDGTPDSSPSPSESVGSEQDADAASEPLVEETDGEPEPRDVDIDLCALLDETALQNAFGPYSVTQDSLPERTTSSGSVISACSWDIVDNLELATIELSSYVRYTGTQDAGRLLEYRASHEEGNKSQTGDRGFALDSGGELFVVNDAFFELDIESADYGEDTLRAISQDLADTVVTNYSNQD